jgi:KUP system potassium uptake protein
VEELSAGIRWVELRFGFAENPMCQQALLAQLPEVECDPGTASFFLGREMPVPSLRPELPLWQERLYAFMVQCGQRARLLRDRFATCRRTRYKGRDMMK